MLVADCGRCGISMECGMNWWQMWDLHLHQSTSTFTLIYLSKRVHHLDRRDIHWRKSRIYVGGRCGISIVGDDVWDELVALG